LTAVAVSHNGFAPEIGGFVPIVLVHLRKIGSLASKLD
jgi:hypothetical protein